MAGIFLLQVFHSNFSSRKNAKGGIGVNGLSARAPCNKSKIILLRSEPCDLEKGFSYNKKSIHKVLPASDLLIAFLLQAFKVLMKSLSEASDTIVVCCFLFLLCVINICNWL